MMADRDGGSMVRVAGLLAAASLLGHGLPARAQAPALELTSQQAAHARAGELAARLVDAIFVTQLNQLDENQLLEEELAEDIRAARDSVVALKAGAMRELTALLDAFQTAEPADREPLQRQARGAARRIAIQLMAERKRLRLRASRPDAEQVEAIRQALQSVRDAQQELRQQTESSDLDAGQRADLARQQEQLREQVDVLREPLGEAAQLGEQALATWDAANAAARHLAAGQRSEAIERQETVLRMLDEMLQRLAQPPDDPAAIAEQVQRLEELAQSLDQLLEQQSQATAAAGDDPQRARELESDIHRALDEMDASSFGQAVESQLERAEDAVANAEQLLQDETATSASDRLQAVQAAEQELLDTAAEVQSQLADLQQSLPTQEPGNQPVAVETAEKNQSSVGATQDLGGGGSRGADAALVARDLTSEPWFTRLPPELQRSIRAAARSSPPRGYADKLRRYFVE